MIGAIWQAIERDVVARISKEPAEIACLYESWGNVSGLADVAFQNFLIASPSLFERYVTASLAYGIEHGLVAAFTVKVAQGPLPDKEVDGNQVILEGLPDPLWAKVAAHADAGALDADGWLGWDEPITAHLAGERVEVPSMALPLEIGYMAAGKTCWATSENGPGLARWPYRSDRVWCFIPRHALVLQ